MYEYPVKNNIGALLSDEDTFSTVMIALLLDHYGPEFLKWAPETIKMETEEDFGFVWNTTNFDRLMAGIAVLTTDRFYKSLPDFIDICNILSGSPATPGIFDPADSAECAWGIVEAMLIDAPDGDEPFSEEIRGYIGKIIEMEGIINPPDVLKIGLHTGGKRERIYTDFSEDPVMYKAIWDIEAEKTEEINDIIRSRLMLLVEQLSALSLKNGKIENIAERMRESLKPKT